MITKITGTVIGGKRLGRKLGFPTANIAIDNGTAIAEGVYAARATVDGEICEGMANVKRSTDAILLEINIFSFEGDLYGKVIEVELLEYIRGERDFASVEELKETVDNDRTTIQKYFKTHR